MVSRNPYLVRAMYDWVVDNAHTPHLLVDADVEGVEVPFDYVDEGQIVLNVHPNAVQALHMGNDWIEFSARFNGSAMVIRVPVHAVRALFARETGEGVLLPVEDAEIEEAANESATNPPSVAQRPHLRVVK